MGRSIVFAISLASLLLPFSSQSQLQILVSTGATFTKDIKYNNSTGHINTTTTGSMALVYKLNSSFGIELKYSGYRRPTSYLNSELDDIVRIYTTSKIIFRCVMTGVNYYLPLKGIQPFLGIAAGASYVQTTETIPPSFKINFNWGLQTGIEFNLSKLVALRLDAMAIFIPGVSNKSPFFNVAPNGSGFPSFVIGSPSKATFAQQNVNFGIIVKLE